MIERNLKYGLYYNAMANCKRKNGGVTNAAERGGKIRVRMNMEHWKKKWLSFIINIPLRILLFSILCLITLSLYAQPDVSAEDSLMRFVENINAFNRLYPEEKVYLHLDNTGYYLGETIWFKAYVINNAADNHVNSVSGVLYVELLNSRGILLETKKLQIIDGQCRGDFFLTPFNYDYHAGFYEIRAYTRMMLNVGDDVIFSRVIPVFNEPPKAGEYIQNIKQGPDVNRLTLPNVRRKAKKSRQVNLDLFPEGGHLIQGMNCRVAFKVTDKNGAGIAVSGEVVNSKDNVVYQFSSVHDGMGCFEYTPDRTKSKVLIRKDGKLYTFDMPPALPSGYHMNVNALLNNDIFVSIHKSESLPSIPLGLSILCGGRLVSFHAFTPDSPTSTIRIPKEGLPAGVNRITLFNGKGEVYAERMFFISLPSNDLHSLKAIADKETYKPRERISIDFEGVPATVFSLAVRDVANTPKTGDDGDILTNLLLASDLKGYIANPSYYFYATDATKQIALDLLMMVQGWRRYEWQQRAGLMALNHKYECETGLNLTGHVAGKEKEGEIELELALEDGDYLEGTIAIDGKGNFAIHIDTVIYGQYYLLLHSPQVKNGNRNIRLDRWFSPPVKIYSYWETALFPEEDLENEWETEQKNPVVTPLEMQADSIEKNFEIQEVNVNQRRGKDLVYNVEQDRERAIDAGKFYSENSREYMIEKNNGYFFQPAKALNLPVNVVNVGYSGQERWINSLFLARYDRHGDENWTHFFNTDDFGLMHPTHRSIHGNLITLIYLEYIQKIIIREWERRLGIRVVTDRPASHGYVYMYSGTAYSAYRRDPAYRVTTFEGYSKVRDFYTGRPEREDYLPARDEHSRTLYWNPDVSLDSEGKARISFYNNAFCRKIEICAEGITKDGIPVGN